MRKKLTAERKYNKAYYQSHKGDVEFEARRAINSRKYRSKPTTKRKRNAKLRTKWATDAAYRKHISEYQKAWRKKRKLNARKNTITKKSLMKGR